MNPEEKIAKAINRITELVASVSSAHTHTYTHTHTHTHVVHCIVTSWQRYLEAEHFFDFVYDRTAKGKEMQRLLDDVHEHATFVSQHRV